MATNGRLRVALLVEGSLAPPGRARDALDRIWNQHMARLAGAGPFDLLVPISKTNLVSLDPEQPRMSGNAEALDQLLRRLLDSGREFDAAVLAWDLQPPWDPSTRACRWRETLDLYRFLAQSTALPDNWTQAAAARLTELESRPSPSSRPSPPRLAPGMVLPICMDPVFEDLLASNERGIRRALGLDGPRSRVARLASGRHSS